jgi:hypothetical protein
MVGVPHELRLTGWEGPTLFSSEISDGRISTGEHGLDPAGHRHRVVGIIGHSGGESAIRQHGLRELCELAENFFCNAWNNIPDLSAEGIEGLIHELVSEIRRLDPLALEDAAGYWPGWIEELSGQREW